MSIFAVFRVELSPAGHEIHVTDEIEVEDEDDTNWYPQSFVVQLQEQIATLNRELAEVTQRCDHFCKMALVPDGTESRKEIARLQAELHEAKNG